MNPFLTIEQARNAIRQYFQSNGNSSGATVVIHEGRYFRRNAFELSAVDSGTTDAPVIYRAAPDAKVIFDGGYILSPGDFDIVSDEEIRQRLLPEVRDKVLRVDLFSLGITDFGAFGPRGWLRSSLSAPMELSLDGIPQQVARWPNDGTIPLGEVLDSGSIPSQGDDDNRPGVFRYNTERAERWVEAEDLFISGIFGVAWASDTIRVAALDTEAETITTEDAHHYGFAQPGRPANVQTNYYAVNLLEEIEVPGEYYIDRNNGVLYYLPPHPLDHSMIQLSAMTDHFIRMNNASHIHVKGIIFENSRGPGLRIENGEGNRVIGCTLRSLGSLGVSFVNGRNHGVDSCNIHHVGRGGVSMQAGHRPSLTPGEHFVINSDIHHFNRWVTQYNPGIRASGVGHYVANNHIHQSLHQAITFSGNDHYFEFNEIHRVLRDISDMGSIYVGRNPTFAGNVIQHNFFHHISLAHEGGPGVQAIFFDDDTIYVAKVFGNVFYRTGSTGVIKFHGGGGASIANNISINNPQLVQDSPGDIQGINRAISKMLTDEPFQHGFPAMVEAMNIAEDPFRIRYPYLYDTWANGYNNGTPRWNNHVTTSNSGWFNDPAALNFGLVEGAPPLGTIAEGVYDRVFGADNIDILFEPIPFDQIGLYQNDYRVEKGPFAFDKFGPVDGTFKRGYDSLQLWWQPSLNADSYIVRIAKDVNLSEIVREFETSTNHAVVTNLESGERYFWQVEAVIDQSFSNAGRRIANNQPWSFTLADFEAYSEDFEDYPLNDIEGFPKDFNASPANQGGWSISSFSDLHGVIITDEHNSPWDSSGQQSLGLIALNGTSVVGTLTLNFRTRELKNSSGDSITINGAVGSSLENAFYTVSWDFMTEFYGSQPRFVLSSRNRTTAVELQVRHNTRRLRYWDEDSFFESDYSFTSGAWYRFEISEIDVINKRWSLSVHRWNPESESELEVISLRDKRFRNPVSDLDQFEMRSWTTNAQHQFFIDNFYLNHEPLKINFYDDWKRTQIFSSPEEGEPDFSRQLNLPNLLLFALGIGQTGNEVFLEPEIVIDPEEGQKHLGLLIQRNPKARGLDFLVEVSLDLVNWESGMLHTTVVEESADLLRVHDNLPYNSEGPRFIRLRVDLIERER